MNIGYIGLGLMGRPCARHLMRAGHKLFIWARNPEKVRDLVEAGAVMCASPAEVGAKVELLFTNLSDTPDVREILLGKNGVAECGQAGLIVVDMSTISATATREMARELAVRGITMADAPVSGGTVGAENATLTFMVGASPEVFEKIRPILEVMAGKVTRIGEVGAGQVAKSCNQIMFTSTLLGVAEAFKLARALDVDLANIREALMGGFAQSRVLELHGQRIIDKTFAPGFKIALHHKDFGIAKSLYDELGLNMPTTALALEVLTRAMEDGDAELDSAAIAKVIDKL